MPLFILATSCLTTIIVPWFMDQTFQVPMHYCFFTALDFTFTTRHIHDWDSFPLWPSLFSPSGAIYLLFPSNILDTYRSGEAHLPVSYIFAFYTVHGVLKARTLKLFVIPFSSGPRLVVMWLYLLSQLHYNSFQQKVVLCMSSHVLKK